MSEPISEFMLSHSEPTGFGPVGVSLVSGRRTDSDLGAPLERNWPSGRISRRRAHQTPGDTSASEAAAEEGECVRNQEVNGQNQIACPGSAKRLDSLVDGLA
jgi:hypothetical protein